MTSASALSVAKQFYHAFELCRGNGLTSVDGRVSPEIPSVVNLAFAVELAVKAVLLAYVNSPRGHGLKVLFEQLPEPDRTFISSNILFPAERFENEQAAVSEAFVEWRYIHEQRGAKSISLKFLMHFWNTASMLAEQKRKEQLNKMLLAGK